MTNTESLVEPNSLVEPRPLVEPAETHTPVSANDIADALGRPRPTEQQRAVIEAGLDPALVIAGAGSGKTETMANRVLWLLANGLVEPGQILGLTFTRKAAGELSARIRERIRALADNDLIRVDAGLAPLLAVPYDEFDPPNVATYNSFANTIFRDNAILLGRESDGAVLGEAAAWQLARRVVIESRDPRLAGLGRSVDQITRAVLTLSQSLGENIADAADVRRFAEDFTGIADLPAGGRGAYADVDEMAKTVGGLPVVLDAAERYAAAKKERGFVEYSDQVALALEVVRTVPTVATDFRDRYRVVLLDEYQDTSVVQTWLLAALFAKHPVMAVGDPNQSIYGWRGASAANLEQFATQFAGGTASTYSLTTSWRNGRDILRSANTIVAPLVPETRVPVARLEASFTATDVPVDVIFEETVEAEAEAAAAWLKQKLSRGGENATAAMLFRTRKSQQYFLDALRKAEVPYHVLGIGGLMAEPEIADLVSALTVLHDPAAGSELVRLLAGSRWRIGVKDLHALSRVASWLRDRDLAQQPLDDDVREQLRDSVADGEGGSIIDALDFVAHAKPGHGQLAAFSEAGLQRLRHAGLTLERLRGRAGGDLLDLVTVVEQELLLDIETAANETHTTGRAAMEAFFDALSGYLAIDDTANLGGFLGWLREAEWREGLAPRPEDPEPGTVQVLTIHGSKGLEWDHVVVPRMVVDELPARSRDGSGGWISFGALPWPFRGDAADMPEFDWQIAETRKELVDLKKQFAEAVKHRHELEERRLAYVAVTRARHSLLMSGSFWATQTKPRTPSPYLIELQSHGVIAELPDASQFEENPLGDRINLFSWPRDPLGDRRPALEAAAERVRSALPDQAGVWQRELDLLLEERRRRLDGAERMPLPGRVPASRFKDFVTDPAAVAASLRRPMPERPYRATRLGTLFHTWVEQRYGVGGTAETIDALATELDVDDAPIDEAELVRLQGIFERSPWATRTPVDVEREIHLVLDGQVVVCKIDAVYADGDGFQVVDWKTGKAPRDAADLENKQLQLALYRLAYAKWRGIDPALISAVFYYVSDDRVIEPERIFEEDELVALWRQALHSD
ncbi:ATP-dependent DNA helicase [Diaminobutyricimonas sp. TR449]|uniref:ATP-dependent helicase n=1 Tax=Diaminobutyricimonas sp. TR449 TaxID=2708076 RepID=UPI0014211551|nr:ATP-dependent DNA helicase [Diaminobutyricimonas sp. TR449]